MRILIVEDNEDIAGNLYDYLEGAGNEVEWVQDGYAALGMLAAEEFDAVVLDLLLPRLSGMDVCRVLRKDRHVDVPILMLTALDSVKDKVQGFEAGADDYLAKPFAMEEVLARLKALVNRRGGAVVLQPLAAGPISYDPLSQTVWLQGSEVVLQPKSLQILLAFLKQPQRTFGRAEIERIVWGNDEMRSEAVRAHMSTLRRALHSDSLPVAIQTLHGIGYRLSPEFLDAGSAVP
ncbi:response regulator transcription factor [Anianabacter salinae]|uniref:response regulator transcription factor n=1 Tax=Anianabacter salinae TaxID=2851023 RepID=UPI00225E22FF|nr:response regulator transcription factor [Anianabacter salinae]MBV0912762.1 response regulator transcription factor [Anianabacter salinae]